MSQRDSGYARKDRDAYETPAWVTDCLMPHIGKGLHLWEPAAGSGKMERALQNAGHLVDSTDIVDGRDFLTCERLFDAHGIVTNPPYALAGEFISHALNLMRPDGFVAMLLRTDFDHAKSREHLFKNCRMFSRKVVLTKRIRWVEGSSGSPSFNHAWFVWDYKHSGRPALAYAP